jgi:hypothetical protein
MGFSAKDDRASLSSAGDSAVSPRPARLLERLSM